MRQLRPSLTVSILAFLGLLLLLTWLLFSTLAFNTAAKDIYTQKGEHIRTMLKVFVSLLPEELPVYPEGFLPTESAASLYVQKLSEGSSLSRLTLLDKNGKVIFSHGDPLFAPYSPFEGFSGGGDGGFVKPDGRAMVQMMTVARSGEPVARAAIMLSLEGEKERLNRSRQLLIAYFLLDFVLLLAIGSYILSRIIVAPINRLLTATEKITGGHYDYKLNITGSAELARLAKAFNTMAASLKMKDAQVSQQMKALEQVNAELELAREEAVRTEKMASIGLLAAGMAHEIGTPLAAIIGYAELIAAEESGNPEIKDYAARIGADSARIDRIIRGLLDYSRPRKVTLEKTDLSTVAAETVRLMTEQGLFKGIKVEYDSEQNLPAVDCDRHQLQQVLLNLLLNARDAVGSGGKIKLSCSREGDFVRLDVLDNGCGIPAEDIKRIFDPFFTTKPPGKGTGLGLAIAARIVEGFGGRLTVDSRRGEGSCFTLRIKCQTE